MRGLRRFAAVGLVVTAVDVVALLVLAATGLHPLAADALSVVLAAAVSYLLHRYVTFGDDPHHRWISRPGSFVAIAAVTAAVDVLVLYGALSGAATPDDPSVRALLVAKVIAVAVAGASRTAAYRALLFSLVHADLSTPSRRPPPPGDVRFTVVVPAYRAERVIGRTVERIRGDLADVEADGGLEVLVVDDGSPDATATVARAAGAHGVIELSENRGKGAAVRAGMLAASGRTVAFTDADLSYSPHQLRAVLTTVEEGWDAVVGSRHHVETVTLVRAGRLREVSGRVFNRLTAAVLLGRYRDTQCGLKGFRGDVAQLIFSHTQLDGFAFDVEVLHLCERYRLALTEVPVALQAAEESTVRVGTHAVRMVRDLFRIRQAAAAGVYDLPGDVPLPEPAAGSGSEAAG